MSNFKPTVSKLRMEFPLFPLVSLTIIHPMDTDFLVEFSKSYIGDVVHTFHSPFSNISTNFIKTGISSEDAFCVAAA